MASCNECSKDTTGTNRIRGRCNECIEVNRYHLTEDRCVLCDRSFPDNNSKCYIKTKNDNSHAVCYLCWSSTEHSKDSFPGRHIPKKRCRHCSKKIAKYTKKRSCSACMERLKLFVCNGCHSEVDRIDKKLGICKTCEEKRFKKCVCCDGLFNTDKIRNRDVSSNCTCNDCYEASKSEIKSYNYKYPHEDLKYQPPFVDKESKGEEGVWNRGRKIPYLGVEIEIECTGYYNSIARKARLISKDRIFNKGDGTISHGFELVSHPFSLEYHIGAKENEVPENHMNWKEVFSFLIGQGCLSHNTKSCGLHIHVNKSFMSGVEINKLTVFINSHMQEVSKIARRSKPSYAPYKKLNKEDFKGTGGGGRSALNTGPSNTVEFRMFKGTLKYSTFIASLQFVDASVRFVKNISWKDVCNTERSWKMFMQFIDENKYQELTKYIKLRKIRKPVKGKDLGTLDSIINKTNAIKLRNYEEGDESTCA